MNTPSAPLKPAKNHRKLVFILVLAAMGMFGFCYALVPLYDKFCEATGLLGKTAKARAQYDADATIDTTRTVTIDFIASVANGMPWTFEPTIKRVVLHPGQLQKVSFKAHNLTNRTVTSQTVPSVTPGLAASYVRKTECFCFQTQTLSAGEVVDMPMIFFLDKELPKDIHHMTVSYSLFEAKS